MKKLMVFVLVFLPFLTAFGKSKKNKRPDDLNSQNTSIDFSQTRSEMWDETGTSKLATLNTFPAALYDLRGFQIIEQSETREISALNYYNPFIRSSDSTLLALMPIFEDETLTGVHLSDRFFKVKIENSNERDFFILRPKNDNNFSEEYLNQNENEIFDKFFLFDTAFDPILSAAYQRIKLQFGFIPILKRFKSNDYIIAGTLTEEIEDDSLEQDQNFKIKNLKLPPDHIAQHIGKFTQLVEKEHGQKKVIHSFIHQLSEIQRSIYLNTYQNNEANLTAIPLYQKDIYDLERPSENNNSNQVENQLENLISQKNKLFQEAINSILLVEDHKVQSFIKQICHEISFSLRLSSTIAPKCYVMATYRPFVQVLAGNYVFISAGSIKRMNNMEGLVEELLIQFAHILKGNTLEKIPLKASIGDLALPLAIAGNYFSYVTLTNRQEKMFIQSWFHQLALHPNSMAKLGQTLISQNLLIAASNFSMQQEFEAGAESGVLRLRVPIEKIEKNFKQQFLNTIEFLKN